MSINLNLGKARLVSLASWLSFILLKVDIPALSLEKDLQCRYTSIQQQIRTALWKTDNWTKESNNVSALMNELLARLIDIIGSINRSTRSD